jgi:hypothetical protein
MAASGSYRLLVEGSWGWNPPMNLSTGLQMYFQRRSTPSCKCEVYQQPGSPPHFMVLFDREDGERAREGVRREPPACSSGETGGGAHEAPSREDVLSPPTEIAGWSAAEWTQSAPGCCGSSAPGRRLEVAAELCASVYYL